MQGSSKSDGTLLLDFDPIWVIGDVKVQVFATARVALYSTYIKIYRHMICAFEYYSESLFATMWTLSGSFGSLLACHV